MESQLPQPVERISNSDEYTDVTEEYEEMVDMFIEISDARVPSIPLQHAIAYTEDESERDYVIFMFIVSTIEELDDYAFELAIAEEDADSFFDEDKETERSAKIDSFRHMLNNAHNTIWKDITEVDE